ncbi:hypothetical protein Taro_019929 [Colocasia esculenta]|uniref:Uncharacterized protein n=1 Tax=Colocasia esculenta TaxID=4460 RepID=A0A843UV25_COLES|nr:hypothetical protein [Colocasia esculenta]
MLLPVLRSADISTSPEEIVGSDSEREVWLHVVGVVSLLMKVSRGEMSLGMRIMVSSRSQNPRVLPIPRLHSRLNWRLSRLRSELTCGGPRCYVLGSRMVLWRLVWMSS